MNAFHALVVIITLVYLWYFFIVVPQRKIQKKELLLQQSIQLGTRITFPGGNGTITLMNHATVIVLLENGSYSEVLKHTITQIENKQ